MSYDIQFIGQFQYHNTDQALQALAIIDAEDQDPDYEEMNILERNDFKLLDEKATLQIEYLASIPASCWYGCQRVLRKMSAQAIAGEIQCRFQGDAEEYIVAGEGW